MTVDEIVNLLAKWEGLGKKTFPSGTVYFGPIRGMPGRNGWLHQVFRPISRLNLDKFAQENPFHERYEYSRQLYDFNGAVLFLKCFFLYGLRIDREMDSVDLPWDLVITNIGKQEIATFCDGIVIGGGQFGESSIAYIESASNEILAFDESSKSTIFKWLNFDMFFRSEILRLNSVFNQDGTPPVNFDNVDYY